MKTRQKSDDRVVPDGDRKAVGNGGSFARRGGKAVAVNQQVGLLGLAFATAGNTPDSSDATSNSTGAGLPAFPRREVRQAKGKEERAQLATMEDRRGPHRTAPTVRTMEGVVDGPAAGVTTGGPYPINAAGVDATAAECVSCFWTATYC